MLHSDMELLNILVLSLMDIQFILNTGQIRPILCFLQLFLENKSQHITNLLSKQKLFQKLTIPNMKHFM
jgi:hypothetical protein